jgi:Recombination endonuclease VII
MPRTRPPYNSDELHASFRKRSREFGLSIDDLLGLMDKQGGRCAICDRAPNPGARRLAIDHDHASGVVRGLLCYRCNSALGLLRGDPNILRRAIEYLERVR